MIDENELELNILEYNGHTYSLREALEEGIVKFCDNRTTFDPYCVCVDNVSLIINDNRVEVSGVKDWGFSVKDGGVYDICIYSDEQDYKKTSVPNIRYNGKDVFLPYCGSLYMRAVNDNIYGAEHTPGVVFHYFGAIGDEFISTDGVNVVLDKTKNRDIDKKYMNADLFNFNKIDGKKLREDDPDGFTYTLYNNGYAVIRNEYSRDMYVAKKINENNYQVITKIVLPYDFAGHTEFFALGDLLKTKHCTNDFILSACNSLDTLLTKRDREIYRK